MLARKLNNSCRHYFSQSGFSLLEVLIAFAVISIGLLGVAKMQSVAFNSTKNSNSRSLAAIFGASVASTMFANQAYWRNGSPTSTVTVTKGVLSDETLSANTVDCFTAQCSPSQLASYDLRDWGVSLGSVLPSGSGKINCAQPTGSPVTCNVQIYWQEKLIAINQSTVATANSLTTQTFTLLVQP